MYLGIDYGRKKIGLALADSKSLLAQPYKVIKYQKVSSVVKNILNLTKTNKIKHIVVGISEGKMANETKKFTNILKEKTNLPISFQDETLSTKQANRLSIEAGIGRKKRKGLEDAYSATIILQKYLDDNLTIL